MTPAKCCPHRAADHLGFGENKGVKPGALCCVPGCNCKGWISRKRKTPDDVAALRARVRESLELLEVEVHRAMKSLSASGWLAELEIGYLERAVKDVDLHAQQLYKRPEIAGGAP